MKDLYTFDASEMAAQVSYEQVKNAYRRIFGRIGLPYLMVCSQAVKLYSTD